MACLQTRWETIFAPGTSLVVWWMSVSTESGAPSAAALRSSSPAGGTAAAGASIWTAAGSLCASAPPSPSSATTVELRSLSESSRVTNGCPTLDEDQAGPLDFPQDPPTAADDSVPAEIRVFLKQHNGLRRSTTLPALSQPRWTPSNGHILGSSLGSRGAKFYEGPKLYVGTTCRHLGRRRTSRWLDKIAAGLFNMRFAEETSLFAPGAPAPALRCASQMKILKGEVRRAAAPARELPGITTLLANDVTRSAMPKKMRHHTRGGSILMSPLGHGGGGGGLLALSLLDLRPYPSICPRTVTSASDPQWCRIRT